MTRVRLPVLAAAGAAVLALAATTAVVASTRLPAGPGWLAVPLTPEPPSLYAGTPASGWAEGSAGIAMPPVRELPDARRVGHHPTYAPVTREEVAELLTDVRAALVATRLDPTVLVDHDPTPYLDSQAPWTREQWTPPAGQAEAGFVKPHRSTMWVTKLAEGVNLAAPPRVAATVTYEPAVIDWSGRDNPVHHVVIVRTEGVWVYALTGPGVPDPALVVVRDAQVWDWPADFLVSSIESNRGVHHRRWEGETRVWGADCELYETEGLIRLDPTYDLAEVPPAAWDLDAPMPPPGSCTPPDPPDPLER